MTQAELEKQSRDVAEKYGIDATETEYWVQSSETWNNEVWLHDDSARCFDLMVEHDLWGITIVNCHVKVNTGEYSWIMQEIVDNRTQEAARIAILKALLAKDKP